MDISGLQLHVFLSPNLNLYFCSTKMINVALVCHEVNRLRKLWVILDCHKLVKQTNCDISLQYFVDRP